MNATNFVDETLAITERIAGGLSGAVKDVAALHTVIKPNGWSKDLS